ncbi:hypothetical protein GCM10010169_23390 [Micromonospora fulviviridis]|uniref:hypothetical protein n=1 Tax=Micromonospora fulviviridis TaxID=47860 RepID=UPI0016660953|nr:hypothetical protein [Micromonospora fulviviridis]GGR78537.1 hypothetical protein GCM10010169_23390 [Micromonospora fulviviridis]
MATAQEQAQKLFTEYTETVERIRGNKAASREGKRADLARTYLTARERMDGVFATADAQRAARRRELERRLFGAPTLGDQASTMLARRDAMDRAARLTSSDDAQALLRSALTSGDETLARAVVQWGYERRDAAVVDAYSDARPHLDPDLAELWQMPDKNPTQAGVERMRREMNYPITRPAELHDVPDMHLQAVADGRELAQTA